MILNSNILHANTWLRMFRPLIWLQDLILYLFHRSILDTVFSDRLTVDDVRVVAANFESNYRLVG